MNVCANEEREAGRAYPKTCPTCRLGPCRKMANEDRLQQQAALSGQSTAALGQSARNAHELQILRTGGVIEIMVRNPNVDSFVREKEARIAALEADLASMSELLKAMAEKASQTP